jgi:N-methylhydantoinase B
MGVHNEWEANADPEPVYVHYAADPYDYLAAPAIDGGKLPPANQKELVMANGQQIDNEQVREAKAFVLHSGDRVIDYVQGGCGVGNPLERDVDLVKKDVRDGLVSAESAKNDYGVIIDSETFEVDMQATEELRRVGKSKNMDN